MSIAKIFILGYPYGTNLLLGRKRASSFQLCGADILWLCILPCLWTMKTHIKWCPCKIYIHVECAKGTQKCTFSSLSQYLTTADFYQAFQFLKSFSFLHAMSLGIPLVAPLESWWKNLDKICGLSIPLIFRNPFIPLRHRLSWHRGTEATFTGCFSHKSLVTKLTLAFMQKVTFCKKAHLPLGGQSKHTFQY